MNTPPPDIRGILARFLLWAVLMTLALLLIVWNNWLPWLLQIMPVSILYLSKDGWAGIGVTVCASMLAWVAGVALGHWAGVLSGWTLIAQGGAARYRHYGKIMRVAFDGMYIIPLVLTLSFLYALLMSLYLGSGLPRWLVATGMIVAAGLILPGYQVYRSVYAAVADAKSENLSLVHSLWDRGVLGRHRALTTVMRLRDCRIMDYSENLIRAFHLAIVAVVILESITPNIYEHFFPQTGPVYSWLGGVGRQILSAQQNNEFRLIAGYIWALLGFDLAVTQVIGMVLQHRWKRYYTRK